MFIQFVKCKKIVLITFPWCKTTMGFPGHYRIVGLKTQIFAWSNPNCSERIYCNHIYRSIPSFRLKALKIVHISQTVLCFCVFHEKSNDSRESFEQIVTFFCFYLVLQFLVTLQIVQPIALKWTMITMVKFLVWVVSFHVVHNHPVCFCFCKPQITKIAFKVACIDKWAKSEFDTVTPPGVCSGPKQTIW